MSWVAVAKKDFRDASQSRALWGLVVVFVGVASLLAYAYAEFPTTIAETDEASVGGLVFFMASAVGLFVSLTAIVVCYKSIAGEREIGSIKLLLALPHTRRDVFVGKLVGRAGVLVAAVAVGLAVGYSIGFALIGTVEVVPVLVFLLLTLVFTVAYVGIVVSISATTGSTTRATTLAIGFFLLFELVWDAIPMLLVYVVNGFSLPETMPDWVYLVTQVPPSSSYVLSLIALLPDVADSVGTDSGAEEVDVFYATPELGFAILLFWLVVPLAVGYYRFDAADL
jgi:ABC-2 type transport system permease protein